MGFSSASQSGGTESLESPHVAFSCRDPALSALLTAALGTPLRQGPLPGCNCDASGSQALKELAAPRPANDEQGRDTTSSQVHRIGHFVEPVDIRVWYGISRHGGNTCSVSPAWRGQVCWDTSVLDMEAPAVEAGALMM